MMLGGFLTRSWNVQAMLSYILIWCFFFGWCLHRQGGKVPMSMWIALNTGRPTSAVFHLQRYNSRRGDWTKYYWWFYLATNFSNLWRGLRWAGSFPSGSTAELVIVTFISAVVFIIVAANAGQNSIPAIPRRLVGEMRLIAREPLRDPKDPRFKKWNINDCVPMSAHVKSYPERMQQNCP
jgi:hypothetical protein